MKLKTRQPDFIYDTVPEGDFSSVVKVNLANSTYKAADMTDKAVNELAMHFYTLDEIADHFNTTGATILAKHGDAFRRGKLFPQMKRRILFDQMITQMLDPTLDWKDPKMAPVAVLATKLMEIGWKKSEGYGQKTEVIVTNKTPVNASDFKFEPLSLENKDDLWTEGDEK